MYLWIDNDEDPIVLQENWIKSGMTATAVTEIDTPNQNKQKCPFPYLLINYVSALYYLILIWSIPLFFPKINDHFM